MASVEVRDTNTIWFKHVADSAVVARLAALKPEETIDLVINGVRGTWRRMKNYQTTGAPTAGISPVGDAKRQWESIYSMRRGESVALELADGGGGGGGGGGRRAADEWPRATEAERKAAWEAFKALQKAGWRSEGPPLSRDELHER